MDIDMIEIGMSSITELVHLQLDFIITVAIALFF